MVSLTPCLVVTVVGRMVKWIYTLISTLSSLYLVQTAHLSKSEFDFITDYQIVKTKVRERDKEQTKVELVSLRDIVKFTLVLRQLSKNSSILSRELTSFTVHNASGVYKITNTIVYYHGYIESRESDSYVHGTLYHDKAFEGVLKLPNVTFHLEAVDRRKPWPRDESLMYSKDNIAQYSTNKINFPDIEPKRSMNHRRFKSFSKIYHKYCSPHSDRRSGHRKKRFASSDIKYCKLHIVVDSYFTHFMANGDKIEAAKMLTQAVQGAHETFVSQDFDGNLLPDKIGLVLAGLTFIETIYGYDYLSPTKEPRSFLDHFTGNYRFPESCVAIVFTFQNFGDTLGMAWLAQSSRPARTGIGAPKNHAFATTLLYEQRVTFRVMQLTLVHELGHSFGSTHDPVESDQCAPTVEQGGKYIMFPSASPGTMPNNYVFSPCSKNVIAIIIGIRAAEVLRSYEAPYCGNGVVEKGEECDCGTPLSCAAFDACCTPAGDADQCLLRRDLNAVCSPAVHSCCSADCQVMSDTTHACSDTRECMKTAYCDGESFTCPQPVALPDMTECMGGRKVCESGHCTKSVCEVADLKKCHCQTVADACRLCCLNTTSPTSTCKPANEYDWFTQQGMKVAEYLEMGSLCLNNTGFCGIGFICVQPGAKYAAGIELAQKTVDKWFDQNWYSIIVAILIAASISVVYICTKERPTVEITHAFRAGRISRIIQECSRERRQLNEEIERLNTSVHMFERGQQDVTPSLARLMLLFPLTSVDDLHNAMTRSNASEAGAVKKLILLNQPMLADHTRHVKIRSQMKPMKTTGRMNEQFEGKLMATVDDLLQLTAKERAALGITDPTREKATKLLRDHQKKLLIGTAQAFNKPV